MKLDQLRYFLEAVQCGSISAAARKVHLAQPAFSTHIKALEDELGVQLFERSTKGVRLTDAGERLSRGAQSLFRHVDQVREETINAANELAGEVRIVLASSVASLLAGKLFWETRQTYPHIRLVILDLMRVASDDLVTSRQVDFALLPNVATLAGAATVPVIAQDLYMVGRVPPGDTHGEIDFRNLANYSLVMGGRRNQLRIDLENTAAREGHRVRVAIEQDSLSVFRSIVINGPAYTIVPYSAFATEIEAGLLTATRIVNPSIERTLSFVWHEFSSLSSSASAVRDLLRQIIIRVVAEGHLRGRLL
ncbi:LysR family transcriptional regulator [Microvirga sp. VF16]|uniref:LysR family transcriptional regulator n=1 Tax=Microvirga sp. VF16 TaxID=2807101 RepID=UPI00193E29CE|nr:LysR family transcriptional regulator [Microvirga sp. VF16]QRM35152.1 LysR family transcriptional regulator [Microvirga sp. VF16]